MYTGTGVQSALCLRSIVVTGLHCSLRLYTVERTYIGPPVIIRILSEWSCQLNSVDGYTTPWVQLRTAALTALWGGPRVGLGPGGTLVPNVGHVPNLLHLVWYWMTQVYRRSCCITVLINFIISKSFSKNFHLCVICVGSKVWNKS